MGLGGTDCSQDMNGLQRYLGLYIQPFLRSCPKMGLRKITDILLYWIWSGTALAIPYTTSYVPKPLGVAIQVKPARHQCQFFTCKIDLLQNAFPWVPDLTFKQCTSMASFSSPFMQEPPLKFKEKLNTYVYRNQQHDTDHTASIELLLILVGKGPNWGLLQALDVSHLPDVLSCNHNRDRELELPVRHYICLVRLVQPTTRKYCPSDLQSLPVKIPALAADILGKAFSEETEVPVHWHGILYARYVNQYMQIRWHHLRLIWFLLSTVEPSFTTPCRLIHADRVSH